MFITVEGPEGSGKSSACKRIYEELLHRGYDVILTREPGGIPIAESIREIILNKKNTEMDARTEALLYAAARRQHLVQKVWPALKAGKIVLCDRFIDSSLAYQGGARGLGVDEVLGINLFATEGTLPDLTLLFDIEPEIGLARIAKNQGREVNRLDLEGLDFHHTVRNTFLDLAHRYENRFSVIDASLSEEEVYQKALQVVLEKIKEYQKVLYRTLKNALNKNQVSHAYLLIGEPGIPLLPIANFLAKSLVCDHPTPFACESCFTCLRFDEGNYADFLLLNGQGKTIKKNEIQALETLFEKTSIEEKGKMIYIIHLVENMTTEAVNSLLKFLEEPGPNVYAFLTTENELKVLPTIISRTQRITLHKIPQATVIENAIAQGIPKKDAELLSYYYNDAEEMQKGLEDENYVVAKQAFDTYIDALLESKEKSVYIMQKELIPLLKSKEATRVFLDLLVVLLEELLAFKEQSTYYLTSYTTIFESLTSLEHIEASLLEIMNIRGQLDLNVNLSLILDHVSITMTKGDA